MRLAFSAAGSSRGLVHSSWWLEPGTSAFPILSPQKGLSALSEQMHRCFPIWLRVQTDRGES
jgi:hypothetical protein